MQTPGEVFQQLTVFILFKQNLPVNYDFNSSRVMVACWRFLSISILKLYVCGS